MKGRVYKELRDEVDDLVRQGWTLEERGGHATLVPPGGGRSVSIGGSDHRGPANARAAIRRILREREETSMPEPGWVTSEQAEKETGVRAHTIVNWASRGYVPGEKRTGFQGNPTGTWFVDVEEVRSLDDFRRNRGIARIRATHVADWKKSKGRKMPEVQVPVGPLAEEAKASVALDGQTQSVDAKPTSSLVGLMDDIITAAGLIKEQLIEQERSLEATIEKRAKERFNEMLDKMRGEL